MGVKFSDKALKEYEDILKKYPVSKESAILPVLHLAQREFGYISKDVVLYISELMGVSPVRIWEVATFYTMYNKKPVGKYLIQVCHNLSCTLNGSEELLEHIKEKLNIKTGETTEDGMFTLLEVECLGACGWGPVVQINDDYYLEVTPQKFDEIIEKLKNNGA